MTTNCPSCGSRSCKVFYESRRVPTNNHALASSRAEAIAVRRGDVALTFCGFCGFVFNSAFDPSIGAPVSGGEDNGDHASAFDAFQERLANRLIERHVLHGSNDIPQISCKGEAILTFVCELSDHHEIDDRYVPADPFASLPDGRATTGARSLSEAVVADPADPTCSMMALMLVPDPARFLALLRRGLAGRREMRLFLQVSNFARTLKHIAFWDIQYRYCSYFSPGTLHRLLCARGFTVSDLFTDFDGEHLMADSRAAGRGATGSLPRQNVETIAELARLVARFAHECREKQALWSNILRRVAGAGNRIAIWGAGSSAASFLTTLAVGDEVSYVVDVSPFRQGKYMPGTGHRIVAPDVMLTTRPDVVIVTNSVVAFEIHELLANADCAPTLLIA